MRGGRDAPGGAGGGRTVPEPLTTANTTVVLIDRAVGFANLLRSHDIAARINNVAGLARTARLYGSGLVVTNGKPSKPSGPLYPELLTAIGDHPVFERASARAFNAFLDKDFAGAVRATGAPTCPWRASPLTAACCRPLWPRSARATTCSRSSTHPTARRRRRTTPLCSVGARGRGPRHGTTLDGRIFQTARGGILQDSGYNEVWGQARREALTPAQYRSPLGRRPYGCRAGGARRPGSLPGGAAARAAGRRPAPGPRVLAARLYGVGPVTVLAMTCWLGGAVVLLPQGRPVRRAGRHRVLLRFQALARAAVPAGTAGAALGGV